MLCHALQRCRPGSFAIRGLSRDKTQAHLTAESDVPASQRSMSELTLPVLYRHILRAAQKFPSIKRHTIVQEIKAEFAANKVRLHDSQQCVHACPPAEEVEQRLSYQMMCWCLLQSCLLPDCGNACHTALEDVRYRYRDLTGVALLHEALSCDAGAHQ